MQKMTQSEEQLEAAIICFKFFFVPPIEEHLWNIRHDFFSFFNKNLHYYYLQSNDKMH